MEWQWEDKKKEIFFSSIPTFTHTHSYFQFTYVKYYFSFWICFSAFWWCKLFLGFQDAYNKLNCQNLNFSSINFNIVQFNIFLIEIGLLHSIIQWVLYVLYDKLTRRLVFFQIRFISRCLNMFKSLKSSDRNIHL